MVEVRLRHWPKTAVACKNHGLGTGPDTEFVEKFRDMVAYRLFTDGKLACDLPIASTFSDQAQNLTFAGRELGKTRVFHIVSII